MAIHPTLDSATTSTRPHNTSIRSYLPPSAKEKIRARDSIVGQAEGAQRCSHQGQRFGLSIRTFLCPRWTSPSCLGEVASILYNGPHNQMYTARRPRESASQAVFSSFPWCHPELEPCSFVIPGLGVLVPDVLPLALFPVVSICLTEKKCWNVVPRGCCCPRPCSSGCRSPCTEDSA